MKRFLSLVLTIILLSGIGGAFAQTTGTPGGMSALPMAPETSARSAILMSRDGQILFEKNADARALIASTTKIMTALAVLDSCDPNETVEVPERAVGAEGSSMYLKAGEKLTVRDLLCGLLMVSGNDAALALAYHAAGSVEAFAEMMNLKAAQLGMADSHFKNPHGLDEEGHYSTARDMAALTAAAMKNSVFREIVSTKSAVVAQRAMINHNRLLWDCEGVIGVKTGYTKAAGRTLVSCAQRGGLELVCVTLSDPNDWEDHSVLYGWAFDQFKSVTIAKKGAEYCRLPVLSGSAETVGVCADEDFRVMCGQDENIRVTIRLPEFVYAGVEAGDNAGFLEASIGARTFRARLIYSETVALDESQKLTTWEKLKRAWYLGFTYGMPYNYYPY